jgi:hypothetical protein
MSTKPDRGVSFLLVCLSTYLSILHELELELSESFWSLHFFSWTFFLCALSSALFIPLAFLVYLYISFVTAAAAVGFFHMSRAFMDGGFRQLFGAIHGPTTQRVVHVWEASFHSIPPP